MEVENAQLFVNSPNAITENRKEICDNASAKFQSEEAGNVEDVYKRQVYMTGPARITFTGEFNY